MKCIKGVCPQTSADPKISIIMIDMERGTSWGHYCNIECAKVDMDATFAHIMAGEPLDTLPEPVPPSPAEQQANGVPEHVPVVNLDETWNPNQKYLNDLGAAFAKALKCTVKSTGEYMDENNKRSENVELSYGFRITHQSNQINVDVGNDDYNVLLNPNEINVDNAITTLVQHVQAVLKGAADSMAPEPPPAF